MPRDEVDAIRAAARAEVEADVEAELDALTDQHDGDWATLNALDLVRYRLAAIFVQADDEET